MPNLTRFTAVPTRRDCTNFKRAVVLDPCSYCGNPADVLDHIVSIADGGPGTWDNLTATCNRCNMSKAGRSLLAHLGMASLRRDTDHIIHPILEQRTRWNRLGRPEAA